MRKAKWLAFAVLLWACPQVWAQSFVRRMAPASGHDMAGMQDPGCTGYLANQPQYSLLMPSDEAAQGGMTATLTAQANVSGAYPSHNVTVTYGTPIVLTGASNHGTSAVLKFYANGSLYYTTSVPLNGQLWQGPANNSFQAVLSVTGTNGNTQDRINVIVGSGFDQDELPSNLYLLGRFSFGVPPMTQACQQCINDPSSCTGAQHTPYITATLRNTVTGETKSVTHAVAGVDFSENEYGYGSTDNVFPRFSVSVLPGDGPDPGGTDTTTGEIFCLAVGADIFNQGSTDHYTYKVMKTKIKIAQQGSTTAGVTRWYVDSWCKDIQHVPIWEPIYIDTAGGITPLIKVGQYELSEQDCWAEPGWPNWKCPPITVTPPQPLHIGVGGTKYDCSTLLNTPIPK